MHATTRFFARAEALCAGAITCAVEIVIWHRLAAQGRAMHYYHPIPIASGALLILESQLPHVEWLSLAATMINFATAMNVYNTYYVHVVSMQPYVQPPALAAVGSRNEILTTDIFLPKYTDSFYPWGPLVQILYALMVVVHCTFRAFVTAHVLRGPRAVNT